MISSALWYVSNQTLHNDFEIPYVTEVIIINTNKYKNRTILHSNQLIRTLFNPSSRQTTETVMAGRLSPIANSSEPSMDGVCLTNFSYLNFTNY